MADQFLQMLVVVNTCSPSDCLHGTVTNVEPGKGLTLTNVWSLIQQMWLPEVVLDSANILDLAHAVHGSPIDAVSAYCAAATAEAEVATAEATAAATVAGAAVPVEVTPAVFNDPAIISLGPPSARSSHQGTTTTLAPSNTQPPQTITSSQSKDLNAANASNYSNNNSRSSSHRSTTRYRVSAVDAELPVTTHEPELATAVSGLYVTHPNGTAKSRRRQKRPQPNGISTSAVPGIENGRANWTPTAQNNTAEPPTPDSVGREKPLLQTRDFPQQAGLPKKNGQKPQQQQQKQKQRNRYQRTARFQQQESGWASEDVVDVQEMGDFDFEGSLAKFDKRALFDQMRREDPSDDANRLVTHNRRPAPRPGTAGGKNLHYTENVISTLTTTNGTFAAATAAATAEAATESEFFEVLPKAAVAQPKPVAVATDFWNSDADDTAATMERPSPRELGSRQSSRRGESKARRSQTRKTSAVTLGQGPPRVNSKAATPRSSHIQGFCLAPSGRRICSVSALQMLNLENIAHNELGLTEDMMTENAGRGIAEVALTALSDPAIKFRNGTLPAAATAARKPNNNRRNRRSAGADAKAPTAPTVVILAGNNTSGMRAVASGRHLQSRGVNVLVCVVGIERGERELLGDFQQQIRLFQNLGGSIVSKSALFAHLRKATIPTLTIETAPRPPLAVTLIVDALLGLAETFDELRTSDQATVYELMEWANRNEAFVLAVDVPSGLDPSTGAISIIDGAQLYVQPRYVVALGAPKRGLLEALAAAEAAELAAEAAAAAGTAAEEIVDMEGEEEDDDDDTTPAMLAVTAAEATVADDPARDWQLFVADIGLAAAVWRKGGTKLRRGIDFGDKWVLRMKYEGLPVGEDEESV